MHRTSEMTDKQAVVLMAVRLGHVTHTWVSYRGNTVSRWMLGDRDVTGYIERLKSKDLVTLRNLWYPHIAAVVANDLSSD